MTPSDRNLMDAMDLEHTAQRADLKARASDLRSMKHLYPQNTVGDYLDALTGFMAMCWFIILMTAAMGLWG